MELFLEQCLQSVIRKSLNFSEKFSHRETQSNSDVKDPMPRPTRLWRSIPYMKCCNYICTLATLYCIYIYNYNLRCIYIYVHSIKVYTWSVGVTPAGTRVRRRRRRNFLSRRMYPRALSSSVQPVVYVCVYRIHTSGSSFVVIHFL